MRYRDHPRHRGAVDATDYLAWPMHIRVEAGELADFEARHGPAVRFVFLGLDGDRLGREERQALHVREPDEDEWTDGLTAMRRVMRSDTRARILLGGRVEGYRGSMPGIAEEAWLSLEAGQPVFLLGGFGGCTHDIAETIDLVEPWAGSRGAWAGRDRFREYAPDGLRNGLSPDENAALARTPHIDEAITLVLRGLRRVLDGGDTDAQGDEAAETCRWGDPLHARRGGEQEVGARSPQPAGNLLRGALFAVTRRGPVSICASDCQAPYRAETAGTGRAPGRAT